MKIRTKFTLSMFLTAMLPLVISMGLALWHSTEQTTKLTLESAQGRLDTAAQTLSLFFSQRIAEVSTYSQTAMLKSMDFPQIRPFLMAELQRHETTYEKYILGTPEGHFYNTSGGNPYVKGLRTFNDKDPNAKPKHIRKRDYWQQTVGNNSAARQVSYVSDPMISYTTGAKQIVVASTIISDAGKVEGMIGGALPWTDIQQRIKRVHAEVIDQLGWDANFFLVSHTGTYWYHWNPEKIVHLKLDEDGRPLLNEIGEKTVVKNNVQDDEMPEIASAGVRMVNGEAGHTSYVDPVSNIRNYLVFSPIVSAGYSIGLLVPQNQIMAPVEALQSRFLFTFLVVALFVTLVAFFLSRKVSSPIVSLNNMTKQISHGDLTRQLKPEGSDEIRELTESFNTMVQDLCQREFSLKQSEKRLEELNKGLEERITERTYELEVANQSLKKEVDDRVATENALRSSENLLKSTGHLAHVGGWKLDVSSNGLSWTEETYRINRVESGPSVDIDVALAAVAPEYQADFRSAIENAKMRGKDFDLELELAPTQGESTASVRVICHACTDNGEVTELIGAYQDITELKKVDQLKSEFVSTVSHELRTPLTSIRGSLALLKSGGLFELNSDEAMNMLDIAERNSERLLHLINDLLDMEKIETGEINFKWDSYPLLQLLEQSLAENDSFSKKLGVAFLLGSNVPKVNVNVDKERFLQVMSNLLSNAAKFTASGTNVDVSASLDSRGSVRVSVRDFGQGVPESFQNKIFTKFSQADGSDTRQQGGTGLGLSISKSIVERMDGEIGFDSVEGEGSTFYFSLPVAG